MMLTRVCILTVVAVVTLRTMPCCGQVSVDYPPEVARAAAREARRLEEAFLRARESGEQSEFLRVFERDLRSEMSGEREGAREWFSENQDRLRAGEAVGVLRLLAVERSDTSASEARGFTVKLSEVLLGLMPKEARVELYRRAVREGNTAGPEGVELSRRRALGRAAHEGLAEFEDEIARHEAELNAVNTGVVSVAAYLRALMYLRRGGTNEEEAVVAGVARVGVMRDEEFRKQMEAEPAFREAVLDTVSIACTKSLPGTRVIVEDVIGRQRMLVTKRSGVAARGSRDRAIPATEGWLSRLSDCRWHDDR